FMHEADTLVRCNAARSLYAYDKWLDTDLLPALDDFLSGGNGRKMAVLHTIGSHWWYRSHYPDSLAIYRPEINSRIVSELTREQMVNSYDNTIIATDSFLSQLVGRLRGLNSVLIFISDHGEALGEEGNYLHGDDYEQLHPTACFVWYSSEYARRYPEKTAALRNNAGRSLLTDVMFHSVLDAASISTPALDRSQSIFTSQ
ncbi:MAG: sulfatase-like hydrolase/transferase, partial [Paramuribaculum sp.]|nr:sulfatase-like hydrolase/transferase [Paramuribaculum sp.]